MFFKAENSNQPNNLHYCSTKKRYFNWPTLKDPTDQHRKPYCTVQLKKVSFYCYTKKKDSLAIQLKQRILLKTNTKIFSYCPTQKKNPSTIQLKKDPSADQHKNPLLLFNSQKYQQVSLFLSNVGPKLKIAFK